MNQLIKRMQYRLKMRRSGRWRRKALGVQKTAGGRHEENPSRWSRRIFGLPVAAWTVIVLGIAGVAWAATLVFSAPDSFTATTTGEVTIGDAETEGIILDADELESWSPGDTVEACLSVSVDNTDGTSPGDLRLFDGGIVGDLTDYLTVRIDRTTSGTISLDAGHFDCSSASWDATPLLPATTFTTFAANFDSYTSGVVIEGSVPEGEVTNYALRFTFEMPSTTDNLSGLTADAAFAFENE